MQVVAAAMVNVKDTIGDKCSDGRSATCQEAYFDRNRSDGDVKLVLIRRKQCKDMLDDKKPMLTRENAEHHKSGSQQGASIKLAMHDSPVF